MLRGKRLTRREFLGRVGVGLALPYFVPARSLGGPGRLAPSERITVGMIGVGGQGTGHTIGLVGNRAAQVVAVCDPWGGHRENAQRIVDTAYAQQRTDGAYAGCATYNDFRELLGREDIDGVVIASPENWHALHGVAAAQAGKDVYVEKALAVTIAESQALVRAVRGHGRVLQVGTHQRSDAQFRQACELVRNGYIGKLHKIVSGSWRGHQGPVEQVSPVPENFDWPMWLGPAPWKPYAPQRIENLTGWMLCSDYCIGFQAGWGSHHNDIALWGYGDRLVGPIEVEGKGVFPKEGMNDTPTTWHTEYVFGDGVRMIFATDNEVPVGIRFEGSDGWVFVNRGGIDAHPKSLLEVKAGPNELHLYESRHHMSNWLECIKTRREPICPIEAGHRVNTICILSDLSIRLGRKLTWDPGAETFINDEQANGRLRRPMRAPWQV